MGILYLEVAVLVAFCGARCVRGDTNVPSSESVPLTFESFLQQPPVIYDARFQLVYNDESNEGELKLDGDNFALYCLSPIPGDGAGGQFDRIRWKLVQNVNGPATTNNRLIMADLRINPRQSLYPQELVNKQKARMLVNLGISEMVPGSVRWSKDTNEFTATYMFPEDYDDRTGKVLVTNRIGPLTVKLNYSNGVPVSAEVADEFETYSSIVYTYDSNFFHGRFPVEFTRFFGEERAWIFRVHDLNVATDHIPISELDPRNALQGEFRSIVIVSNNLRYRLTSGGLVWIPNSLDIAAKQARARGIVLNGRLALLGLFTVPGLYLIHSIWQKKSQKA